MDMTLTRIRYPDDHHFHTVYAWCQEYCQGKFYPGQNWDTWIVGGPNRQMEFELEQDAVLFALRWS